MRDEFVITLRREQDNAASLAGFCLLLFSLIAFALTAFRTNLTPFYPAIAALVMASGITVNIIRMRRGRTANFRYWLLAAALGWLAMPYARWLSVPFVLFAAWEARARLPLQISFTAAGVSITGVVRRRISWQELHSVVLKDGLLTLDFMNNRLLQRETDSPEDEAAFNRFVREQMQR